MKPVRRIPGLVIATAIALTCDGRAADDAATELTRTVVSGEYRIALDLRPQVLRIEVPENSLGPMAAQLPLHPTPVATDFLSTALLSAKAKQFDDGLLAAVELAAQSGLGSMPGKAALLRAVCAALSSAREPREAREVMVAAAALGELGVTPPPDLAAGVAERIRGFEQLDFASRPVGFYTWSPALAAIFRQDRMLQTKLDDPGSAVALAHALEAAGAVAAYESTLAVAERLTNPPAWGDLRPLLTGNAARETVSFFPASSTHESRLAGRLFGGYPPPADFDLAAEIVARVRDGRLSLAPTSESGWYDRQAWSFEPLLIPDRTPEAAKLRFDDDYRGLLVELFKGLMALTRETHIKQVDVPVYASATPSPLSQPIHVFPELTVEPLATHYLRRAQAYGYVRQVLERAFGAEALAGMRRMTAAGPVETPLAVELEQVRALYLGAHALSCRQLGMPPDPAVRRDAVDSIERLEAWRKALAHDPDLATDTRMMVPLFFDAVRGRTKVWVMLGWTQRWLRVHFEEPPAVTVRKAGSERPSRSHPRVEMVGTGVQGAFPIVAEVYVKRVLDRDEFRKLCDSYRTRDAILGMLD